MTAAQSLADKRMLRGIDKRIQSAVGQVGDLQIGTVSTVSPLTVVLDGAKSATPCSLVDSAPTLTFNQRVSVYVFRGMSLCLGSHTTSVIEIPPVVVAPPPPPPPIIPTVTVVQVSTDNSAAELGGGGVDPASWGLKYNTATTANNTLIFSGWVFGDYTGGTWTVPSGWTAVPSFSDGTGFTWLAAFRSPAASVASTTTLTFSLNGGGSNDLYGAGQLSELAGLGSAGLNVDGVNQVFVSGPEATITTPSLSSLIGGSDLILYIAAMSSTAPALTAASGPGLTPMGQWGGAEGVAGFTLCNIVSSQPTVASETVTFTCPGVTSVGMGAIALTFAAAVSTPPPSATVPTAPTGVTAVAGNGQATVSWSPPASNGGSPLTEYVVVPYLNGVEQTHVGVTAPATSIAVGAANGSSATFAVLAINAVGEGPLSAFSTAVTPTSVGGSSVPSAPTGLTATASSGEASLAWTAPSANGSALTNFTVTPFIGGAAQTPISTGSTSTSYTVTGLNNGTVYTFAVSATNGIGTGANSVQSNAVTPSSGTSTGTATPYATIPGSHTWGILLADEFDGSTPVYSGDTMTNGLDTTLWSPYFFSDGGVNNQTACYEANVSISGGYLNLLLESGNSGACLYAAGSNSIGYGLNQASDDGVRGHVGMVPFSYPALIEVKWNFVQTDGQMNNWPCSVYFIAQNGEELDVCEINDFGGPGMGYPTYPGQCMLNVHGPGPTNSRAYHQIALGQLSGWHTISVYWTSTYLDVYIDNVRVTGDGAHTVTTNASLLSAVTGANGFIPIMVVGGRSGSDDADYYGGYPHTPQNYEADFLHIFSG